MSITVTTVNIMVSYVKNTIADITSSPVSTPRSRPSDMVNGLNVEPGSYPLLMQKLFQSEFQFFDFLLIRQCCQFFFLCVVLSDQWIVEIIIRISCLRKNLSILRIHNHNCCILTSKCRTGTVLLVELCNIFFHYTLYLKINC